MHYSYKTHGTCASEIHLDIEGNIVRNISFTGGCNGNLKAISKLCDGQTAENIIETLSGNTCGIKPTSCADQLAKAVRLALLAEKKQA